MKKRTFAIAMLLTVPFVFSMFTIFRSPGPCIRAYAPGEILGQVDGDFKGKVRLKIPPKKLQYTDAVPVKRNKKKSLGIFKVTAYCSCKKCCGKTDGITASGIKVKEGVTIASDWNVLPFGTTVYIKGVGKRTVHDKGGAIKGRKIDVYFATHEEARKFGVKKLQVWEEKQ